MNITKIVDEITHIANRIKSLTVPCSSRLTLIFFSSGRSFSCCLLGARDLFGDGRVPVWLQILRRSRLTWTGKHEANRLPSWLQVLRPFYLRAAAKREGGRQSSRLLLLRPSRLTGTAIHEAGLLLFLQPPGHRFLGRAVTGLLHAGIPSPCICLILHPTCLSGYISCTVLMSLLCIQFPRVYYREELLRFEGRLRRRKTFIHYHTTTKNSGSETATNRHLPY